MVTKFDHQAFGWSPQSGPQDDLLTCPLQEIFFGGARGGGKTDGVLGKWAAKEREYKQHFNAIMFRRTAVSAEDAIERSREIYRPLGGRFNESKLRWRMPNGGRVSFAYLDTIADANVYQGRNVTDAWVEEAGQYPSPAAIDRLFGILRSSHGVPIQLILTANPGGPGQHWIRERYQIHPFPVLPKIMIRQLPTGKEHRVAVIPSRITDNKILLANDPGYVDRLQLVGSPQLVRAWLEGDWSAIEGAFFTEWDEAKHVLAPFSIPSTWMRFRSADWGSFSPFSIGWWAVATDDYATDGSSLPDDGPVFGTRANMLGSKLLDNIEPDGGADLRIHGQRSQDAKARRIIPRGALIHYREWYGDVGGKLTAEEVANGIVEREKLDRPRLSYGVLDPSAFAESGGPSIAERINKVLIDAKMAAFRPADNKRVARTTGDRTKSGPMGGWDMMRQRLKGIDGVPMLYVFNICKNFVRTVPVLQHDEQRSEDIDCWVAGTLVATPSGDKVIEDIRTGDLVETPIGPRRVLRSYLSGASETIGLRLSDGRCLQGTPHHKIYIKGKGLVALKDATYGDLLVGRTSPWRQRLLSIAVLFISAARESYTTIQIRGFCAEGERDFTDRYGWMPEEKSRNVGTFTTLMAITTITSLKILNAYRRVFTANFTIAPTRIFSEAALNGERLLLLNACTGRSAARYASERRYVHRRAAIVDALSRRESLFISIAQKLAVRLPAIGRLKSLARFAESYFGLNVTATRKSELVRITAAVSCAKPTNVYNLTVDDAHLFYANGILSSNTDSEDHCGDMARYACVSRPWVRKIAATLLPPRDSYRPAQEERNDGDSVLLL